MNWMLQLKNSPNLLQFFVKDQTYWKKIHLSCWVGIVSLFARVCDASSTGISYDWLSCVTSYSKLSVLNINVWVKKVLSNKTSNKQIESMRTSQYQLIWLFNPFGVRSFPTINKKSVANSAWRCQQLKLQRLYFQQFIFKCQQALLHKESNFKFCEFV